jgi:hypothetical protein
LIDGPVLTSWPAAPDGRPLVRIWESLAMTGGFA